MRILYAFDDRIPSPKADREQLVSTAAALSRLGPRVTLLLPRLAPIAGPEEILRYYGVRGRLEVVRYASFGRPRALQKPWAAARSAFSRHAAGADLVYTRNLPIAFAAAAGGHRVAFDHYRPWPDQYPALGPALRRLMRSPRFVGAILHSRLARRSYARIGVPEDRLLVAHNGYEPDRLRPVLARLEARTLLGLPSDRPIVVYTGRVEGEKGLGIVLEMARRRPEVLFVLVGGGRDAAFEAEAERVANVSRVPWQPYDRVARYLYAADVLLSPPSVAPLVEHGNTVLPLKLFTYLGAGRAVLAPRAADTEEILEDGRNARLVPPGEVAAAAAALDELLADGELRARLERGARRSAEGLTWDARARRIHGFLLERLPPSGLSGEGEGGRDPAP